MNAQPHTHEVKISRQYNNSGAWRIDYGDTRITMVNWWHFLNKEAALNKRVAKAIRRHDRGSLRAGDRTEMIQAIQTAHNEMLTSHRQGPGFHSNQPKQDAWGTDLLRENSGTTS